MSLTPRAMALVEPTRGSLRQFQSIVLREDSFDPETVVRTFTVAVPGSVEMLFGPCLLAAILRQAPGVRLTFRVFDYDTVLKELDADRLALAIGLITEGGLQHKVRPLHGSETMPSPGRRCGPRLAEVPPDLAHYPAQPPVRGIAVIGRVPEHRDREVVDGDRHGLVVSPRVSATTIAISAIIVVITGAFFTRKGTVMKRGVVAASLRDRPIRARASSTAPRSVPVMLVMICGKRR